MFLLFDLISSLSFFFFFFFFNDTATTQIYTLSYTTLFRSRPPARPRPTRCPPATHRRRGSSPRSEEHTSELQSHVNLVCRLLLEKKKKKQNQLHQHTLNTIQIQLPTIIPANKQKFNIVLTS